MKQNLTRKIIAAHLVEGSMTAGSEVAVRINQTLTCRFGFGLYRRFFLFDHSSASPNFL